MSRSANAARNANEGPAFQPRQIAMGSAVRGRGGAGAEVAPAPSRITRRPRPAASRAMLTPFKPPPMIAKIVIRHAQVSSRSCAQAPWRCPRCGQPARRIARSARVADEITLHRVAALLGEEAICLNIQLWVYERPRQHDRHSRPGRRIHTHNTVSRRRYCSERIKVS